MSYKEDLQAVNTKLEEILATVNELPIAVGDNSALPIEVATESEMNALLFNATAKSVGSVYKYTGPSGTYENGELYILAEEGD